MEARLKASWYRAVSMAEAVLAAEADNELVEVVDVPEHEVVVEDVLV